MKVPLVAKSRAVGFAPDVKHALNFARMHNVAAADEKARILTSYADRKLAILAEDEHLRDRQTMLAERLPRQQNGRECCAADWDQPLGKHVRPARKTDLVRPAINIRYLG